MSYHSETGLRARARLVLAAAICGALGLAAPSCGCCASSGNSDDCVDGASFSIRAPDDVWPVGAYTIEVAPDDESWVCELDVLADMTDVPAITCTPRWGHIGVRLEADCSRTDAGWQTDDGSACALNQFSITGNTDYMINKKPYAIRVRVARDGVVLLDESRKLRYHSWPTCGDTSCEQATVSFSL